MLGTFPGGQYAYLSIPALGFGMWVNPYGVQTSANAINRVDINFAQIMPFSPANPVMTA